ncbi:MAG: hypothetical protein HC888_12630 [Candidatus Competibacteraceae bacterium]|nr:hypothetical protein [Candidatus Competibacteraceae bacterium]
MDAIFDDDTAEVSDAVMIEIIVLGVAEAFGPDRGVGVDLAVGADLTGVSDVD